MTKKPMSREELESLIVEYRILQGLSLDLQQRVNAVSVAINELGTATSTIDEVSKRGDGSQILIPIGGASYIKASLLSGGKVLIGLGAGISVEKDFAEARKYLEARVSELQQALASLQRQLASVTARMMEVEPKVKEVLEAKKAE